MFTNLEKASGHLASNGVKRVIVTAPSVDVPMLILGVNENKILSEHKVISCASSTLYCLAPIIKVLDDNFGVSEGFITSIHAMTPSLKPLDGICLRGKHWRDHRSILQNIIPAATGACKALGKIMPQVKDKLSGLAFRVPIVNVSILDLTIRLCSDTKLQDIVTKVDKASSTSMENIIKLSIDEAVSSDFIGDNHSCILDVGSSLQLKPNFYKLVCWYENEYSYACRVIDSIIFSDNQLRIPDPRCKMTYVRQKTSKKQNATQQTDKLGKEISIECNKNSEVNRKVLTSVCQNVSFRTKAQPRPLLLKKPLPGKSESNYRDTKKRTELFKIWNDDNVMLKSTTRQNSSVFHTCADFVPQPLTLKRNDNSKAHEHLKKVKKEFSRMVNITEDLLKKSNSNKIKIDSKDKILDEKSIINISKIDNTETARLKITPTDASNKLIKVKMVKNPVLDISGHYESVITTNDIGLINNDNKDITIASSNALDMTKLKSTKYKKIQSAVIENIHETSPFAYDKVETNELDMYSKPVNYEFKEEVANTINTLIDGLLQSMQIQSVIIENNRDKTRKLPNSKESRHAIVNYKTRSSNDSGFFSPEKNEVSEIEVDLNELSNFLSPCSVQGEEMEINDYMNNQICTVNSNISIQGKTDIHSDKYECIEESDSRTYNMKNKDQSMSVAKIHDSIENKIVIYLDDHQKIDISKSEPLDVENVSLTIKRYKDNKSLTLQKQIIDSLNRISPEPVIVVSSHKSRCVNLENTMPVASNGVSCRTKQDIYDKLDSTSATDSENSFQINERKSQVIHITDLTNSLEDLSRLDKICKIIEISDELSDKLFSALDNGGTYLKKRKWSFKDLCERIKLDDFCNKIFGKS
ncbi:uncharacterized protein LOC131851393 isoform X2 [Achroia grisella]|nr:uncharacterized protein LOC131851393 isoform X2 [Achroia grisella]